MIVLYYVVNELDILSGNKDWRRFFTSYNDALLYLMRLHIENNTIQRGLFLVLHKVVIYVKQSDFCETGHDHNHINIDLVQRLLYKAMDGSIIFDEDVEMYKLQEKVDNEQKES